MLKGVVDLFMNKQTLLIKNRIKTICILVVRIFIRLLYIFPLKKNRIVFFSYYGKQYSCNPKAISEYILHNYGNRFEVYWVFKEPQRFEYLKRKGIKLLKYYSLRRLFVQATAKYTISNCGAFSWIPKRKNQIHCNTWHAGGAYKRLTDGTSFNRLLTAQETTHMISSCRLFTKYNIRACFNYSGLIMKIGMPRNDVFFDSKQMNAISNKTRQKLHISLNDFVVLYAPTWRYDGVIPYPDFDMICKAVTKRFNKNPVIIGRSHSVRTNTFCSIIDATAYPDMQDLLCTADMLITDYSSSIWDYSFTYRPCLLYVEDLEKYQKQQGFLTDIYEWGFPVCKSNAELQESIGSFDQSTYYKAMKKHHIEFGSYECGNATEVFCERMFGKVVR